jgi:hypothetical protein
MRLGMVNPLHKIMNPWHLSMEVIMVIVAFIICFYLFWKTREMYALTKHRGIYFFRYAFLFLGFGYLVRFIVMSSFFLVDPKTMHALRFIMLSIGFIVGYFSLIGMLYIIASLVYKHFKSDYAIAGIHAFAIIISSSIYWLRDPRIIFLTHILIFILAIGLTVFERKKAFSPRVIYILLFLFWILNYLPMILGRLLPLELKMILTLISIGIFFAVYYKATRWLK